MNGDVEKKYDKGLVKESQIPSGYQGTGKPPS
jgi:hypothetical protein